MEEAVVVEEEGVGKKMEAAEAAEVEGQQMKMGVEAEVLTMAVVVEEGEAVEKWYAHCQVPHRSS